MTYLEQAIVSLSDLPARIIDFAAARGWTVDVANRRLTRPGGGLTIEVGQTAGTSGYNSVWARLQSNTARYTRFSQPRRQGTSAAPVVLAPTKVHFFGNDAPYEEDQPYIAIVVEFGYNCFRHMFIGNINKLGDYQGGELISSNSWCERFDIGTRGVNYTSDLVKNLFSAGHSHSTDFGQGAGGLNVVHADNPFPWRYFDYHPPNTNNMIAGFTGNEVFGGWSDQINGVLGTRGRATYAGANILVPINLYGPNANEGANYRFRPFGTVPGVRLVRMDGINPAQQIEIATENWMVFPEFSRDTRATATRDQGNGFYWDFETSGMLGLAYRMD